MNVFIATQECVNIPFILSIIFELAMLIVFHYLQESGINSAENKVVNQLENGICVLKIAHFTPHDDLSPLCIL